jgi:peptidyl-prolyl cis-trans isomerase A (cyclophilin A)
MIGKISIRNAFSLGATGLLVGIAALSAQCQAPTQPQSSATKSGTSGQATTKKRPAAASAYDRALLRPALLKAKAPEQYQVKFVTTRGEFTLTVTRAWAPLGADSFYNLMKHHFYDKDDPGTQSNKKGYITFATSGPNTRTTQLFINLKDNTGLDSRGFAPFGVVDGTGMNVVEMFYDQYGDNAGIDQDKIQAEGNAYLQKNFAKLDTIKSATLLTSEPAAASKPATPKGAPATKKPQ